MNYILAPREPSCTYFWRYYSLTQEDLGVMVDRACNKVQQGVGRATLSSSHPLTHLLSHQPNHSLRPSLTHLVTLRSLLLRGSSGNSGETFSMKDKVCEPRRGLLSEDLMEFSYIWDL